MYNSSSVYFISYYFMSKLRFLSLSRNELDGDGDEDDD